MRHMPGMMRILFTCPPGEKVKVEPTPYDLNRAFIYLPRYMSLLKGAGYASSGIG